MENKTYFNLYFQIREPPTPLNIPTPTPSPDRAGPVACLSGPIFAMPRAPPGFPEGHRCFSCLVENWLRSINGHASVG